MRKPPPFGRRIHSGNATAAFTAALRNTALLLSLVPGIGIDPVLLTPRMSPGFVESRFWTQTAWVWVLMFFNSNSIGASMPRLEWRRRRLWKISIYSKIAIASSTRVRQRRVLSSSTCIRDQNASIIALT
jgi:hypothetical protein